MKDTILRYITKQYGDQKEKTQHLSYCRFPEEECTCRDLKDIDYDTPLISGGYVDSFSSVAIVVFLEKTFNITIPDHEATALNLDTVNKMVALITRLKQ